MKVLNAIVLLLLIIGGLNWGLVGIANYDVVAAIFGPMTSLTKLIYDIVGIAALYQLVFWLGKMGK